VAILPAGEIGGWSETRLTRFVEDWFRNHQLPATKALQVDALTIGTRSLTDLVTSFNKRTGDVLPQTGDYSAALIANALDLSNPGTQALTGTLNAGGLQIGGAALPGTEIGYDAITASVNVGTATTAVIPGSAHTFDGSPVMCEFFSPDILLPSVAGATVNVFLFDGATQVVIMAVCTNSAAQSARNPVTTTFRFTPSAGSHTYNIKAAASITTGTPAVQAGTGTVTSGLPPAYLRFTKV
jgi:hypothetical protein